MNNLHRFMILILLLGFLYIVYRFQNQNSETKENPKKNTKKTINESMENTKKYNRNLIDNDSVDLDNISQISIGSLDSTASKEPYKQDSMLNTIENESLSSDLFT